MPGARRGLVIYGSVLAVCSIAIEGTIIARGGPLEQHTALVIALMWSPTLAMIVARLGNRDGIADVSFRLGMRRGGWREYLIAWWFPLVVGTLAYGLAWTTGLAPFATPQGGGLFETLGVQGVPALVVSLAMTMTIGTALSAVTAAGEEFGWRGYMLTRLIDAGVPRPALVSGVIWGLWHTPLILSGQYAAGPAAWLSTCSFLVGMTVQGYLYARVRLSSGSVWPAVLLHATWNAVIQASFDAFVPNHGASNAGNVWVGEAGMLVVIVGSIAILVLVARPFAIRRFPNDPSGTTGTVRTL